jgi:hypothetical protein
LWPDWLGKITAIHTVPLYLGQNDVFLSCGENEKSKAL